MTLPVLPPPNGGGWGVGGVCVGSENPSQLADLAVYSPDLSLEQKVELLETLDIRERLGKLLIWMREVLASLELRKKVREDASEQMDKSQREYLLRQQMEAIKKELGDDTDLGGEDRRKLAERTLPDKVKEALEREIDRLERMRGHS